MTVRDLIIRLQRLKPELDICFEGSHDVVNDFTVENITESDQDDTVIGYVLCEDKQMDLPFSEAWDEKKGMN